MTAAKSEPSGELGIEAIREHYDSLTPLYRTFWGEHIHHGFWRGTGTETAAEAQENLTRELAHRAGIQPGDDVLDIGCGLGGSALLLAEESGCRVHGISISPNQVKTACREAARRGLEGRATFDVRDANQLQPGPGATYDIIWVVECSEHLFDKPRFLGTCAQLLKPGGRLAICTSLAGENLDANGRQLVAGVCEGMLCPSLGTMRDYVEWMEGAGLEIAVAENVTEQVAPTWDLCQPMLNFPLVKSLLATSSPRLRNFAASFSSIATAYRSGAMAYGMFVARKLP